jgi:ribosomal protein S1
MKVDDIVVGTIKNIKAYGIILDCNDKNHYLIHITDVSWDNLSFAELTSKFRIGDKIEAKVAFIRGNNITLTMKNPSTSEELIELFKSKYSLHDELELRVKSIKDHGVYFEIMEGFEGFLHHSDFNNTSFKIAGIVPVKISNLEHIGIRRIGLVLSD